MAISSDKLLNRPSELHRRYGGRLAMQKAQQEKMVGGGPVSIIFTKKSIKNIELIKDNVVKIEGILKGTIAAEKKALDEKKKKESSQRREKQEEKLEAKPDMSMGSIKMPKLPRMGILDWIKNFIGKIILGYFAYRLIEHLPKIIPIVKFIGNATDFIIDVGGKLLNGLATFIDWGYKAYDATRGFIKNIGGENFAQGFDKFVGAIDTALFLTTVLAGDLAAEAMFGRRDGGGGDGYRNSYGGGKRGLDGDFRRGRFGGYVRGFGVDSEVGGGVQGHNLWKQQAKGGELTDAGLKKARGDMMKRYFQRYGRDAFVQRFGQEGLERLPGGMQRGLLQRGARSAFVGVLGKGGAKAVLSTVRPLLKRIPIPVVGALIDFGLSWALGEDPGRAAFRAIGAGLLGSIGTALGGGIGLAGGPLALVGATIGGLAGGTLGDMAGGAIYDMFFGGKKSQSKDKVQKKAGGGITRGGKSQGGVKRTIKKGKYKRVLAPKKPSETKFETEDKNVKEVSKDLDKTKYFGPVLSVSAKILENQKPTQKDYENVGLGLNLLISKGIEEKQLKGGLVAAFAEGGMVDDDFLEASEKGGDISNWVTETFKNLFETKVEKNLRMIKERKGYIDKEKGKDQQDPNLGVEDGGTITGGNADFWTLVAIASLESGTPQGRADVAQSIYNRLASGVYTGKTIKELILAQNQYQPVRESNTRLWQSISDKQSAIAAVGSHKNGGSRASKMIEETASAIQNQALQKSAAQFVGGRTDFWAESLTPPANGIGYVNRNGHRFGWFVGPAAIAYGKKNPGPAKAPSLGDIVVMGGGGAGGMLGGGKFIQGNSGASRGVHFHIGPGSQVKGTILQSRYFADARATAKQAIDYFISKGSKVYDGRRGVYYKSGSEVGSAQQAHTEGKNKGSPGGIDMQVDFEKPVPFPLKTTGMAYRPNGFGVSADIVGSSSFVAHARYDQNGRVAPQEGGYKAYFHGENFGVVPKDGFMLRLHKGEVFKVIDRDSVDLLGFDLTKEIIDIENRSQLIAKAPSIIEKLKAISGYTDYEQPYAEPEYIEVPAPMPISDGGDYSSGGFSMAMGGGGEEDSSFDSLYVGG